MKKLDLFSIFFLAFLAVFFLLTAQNSYAFLGIPGPLTPTIDGPTDVGFSLKTVGSTTSAVTSGVNNFTQEMTSKVKAAKKKFTDKFTGVFDKLGDKKKKAVPASKTIAKTQIADIYQPTSVKKAFYKLFLANPDKNSDINAAYRAIATDFYNDTLVEIYTSVRELEKEMAALTAKVNGLTDTLVAGGGGDGAEAANDNNGAWKNAYIAYDTMNELLKVTEELVAMRAQYEAASALKDYISPAPYKGKGGEKTSSVLSQETLMLADNISSSSFYSKDVTLVFAQLTPVEFREDAASAISSSPEPASATAFAQKRRNAEVQESRNNALGMFKSQADINAETKKATASAIAAQNTEDDDDYEYDPVADNSVSFITSEEPKIASPYEGNREKMEELNKLDPIYALGKEGLEIHNLIQSLPQFREIFEKYDNYVKLHERSLEMLNVSDQCVLQFLGRYYADPEKVWSGGPLGNNVNNYDLRTGVSGWVIKTFEAAKAEKTSPVDVSDFTEVEVDTNVDTGDLTNIEQQKELVKAQNLGSGLNNPSKTEEVEAINRETALLGWKIGAEAEKDLAQDQYSEAPKWGEAQTKFPIWNDQKNFYNQYLEGKYANIEQYLDSLEFHQVALSIAKEINSITPQDPEVQIYNAQELGKLDAVVAAISQEEDKATAISDKELQTLKDVRAADIEKAKAKRDSALAPYLAQRDELYRQLDIATKTLDAYNQRINQLKNEIMEADVSVDIMDDQLEYLNEIDEYGRDELDTDVPVVNIGDSAQQSYAKSVISDGGKISASKELEVKRYQSLAVVQKNLILALQQQIDDLEPTIERIKVAYAEDVKRIEEIYNNSVELAHQRIAEARAKKASQTLLSIYSGSVESNVVGDLIGSGPVKAIIGQSEGLITDTKSYASSAVNKALGDMYRLGDELYLPSSNKLVVKRHGELMDELRQIPLEKLMESSGSIANFGGVPAITTALTTLFQQVMISDACAGDFCKIADEQYFIGLLPKNLDFSAPKSAPDMYMPPLREVVYFDDVDYKNIAQTADGSITRDGFLNYGGEIPPVWDLILQDKVFVERDINLSAILEAGDGHKSFFMRGGRYPCRLNGKVIDVDPYDGQYIVAGGVSKSGSGGSSGSNSMVKEFLRKLGIYVEDKVKTTSSPDLSLPNCQEIEMIGNDGVADKFYYTIRDIEADTRGPAAVQASEVIGNPSELGTLLKPLNNGIQFADKPKEVFDRLLQLKEEMKKADQEYKSNLKDEIYKNAPYDTNQFGDFLNFVEMEMTYRQLLEELKVGIDESKALLVDSLSKVGFKPTANFNLVNDADFNLAKDNLKRLKNNIVNEGFTKIEDVKTLDNEVVEERLKKIKSMFVAMRKDKNELINLSEVSPSDSELDEQIKTEEVNQKVAGEYKKQADDEFKKQIENFIRPFCAAY